jgi:hypothetical protein
MAKEDLGFDYITRNELVNSQKVHCLNFFDFYKEFGDNSRNYPGQRLGQAFINKFMRGQQPPLMDSELWIVEDKYKAIGLIVMHYLKD